MPGEPLIEFAALLEPIPGDDPSGSSLPFAAKQKLEEDRKEIDPSQWAADDPQRPENPKRADWPAIAKRQVAPESRIRVFIRGLLVFVKFRLERPRFAVLNCLVARTFGGVHYRCGANVTHACHAKIAAQNSVTHGGFAQHRQRSTPCACARI